MGRKRKSDELPKKLLPSVGGVKLDAELMEGFVSHYLRSRYDSPHPTPTFHRKLWKMWCSEVVHVAAAAPRDHAKTTAGTQAFGLAAPLFGFRDHVLIVSATESLATSLLKDVRVELTENEELIRDFDIKGLLKDNDTELIVVAGESPFRIIAKGAGQRLRGMKWRNKRPNLILVDDLEDDEEVLSLERREKLRKWFMNALLRIGSDDALFRMAGTVMHEDSLLNRFLHDPAWLSECWRAHASFDDFSEILWPEKYPEKRLRELRQLYINQHNPSGYAMEMLNQPIGEGDHYFRRDRFLPMEGKDFSSQKNYYAAIDFAISKSDRANKTSIGVGGLDAENKLHIVHRRSGWWDADEIVENMIEVQEMWEVEVFGAERGAIEKAIGPSLNRRMLETGVFLNLKKLTPTKDKPSRCRSFQQRHNSGAVRYDMEAPWYFEMYEQMMQFTNRGSVSGNDDDVDMLGMLGLLCADMIGGMTEEEEAEAAWEMEELLSRMKDQGRSEITGY